MIYVHIYIHIYIHIYTYTRILRDIFKHLLLQSGALRSLVNMLCIYIIWRIHIHIYIYIYVHIHMRTHIYWFIWPNICCCSRVRCVRWGLGHMYVYKTQIHIYIHIYVSSWHTDCKSSWVCDIDCKSIFRIMSSWHIYIHKNKEYIHIFISIYIHIYKHIYIYIHRWMDNLYGTPIVWTTMAGSTILSSRCVLVCQCVCHELYDMCHELNILKIDM